MHYTGQTQPTGASQFVTIENCTITLSNINNATAANPMTEGSAGIISMNATALAANVVVAPGVGGSNSNNKFYGNVIQNCNIGISMIGYAVASPFTLADTNNDIGGSSSATGNTIINFGGAAGATNPAAAIRTLAQYGLNVSYNTINNNNGSGTNHPFTLRGIYVNAATSANAAITYNTITLNGGGTTQNVTGIENASGTTAAGNTISISNNTVTNSTYTTATTGGFYGIFNNGATPAALTVNNNTISNNSSAATTSGYFYGIYNNAVASSVTINNNTFSGNSTAALTTGLFAGIYNSASVPVLNINSNTLSGNSTSSVSGLYYPIYNSGTVTSTININSNNIGTVSSPAINFTAANSASQLFIVNSKGGPAAALSMSNNNFYNVLYSIGGAGTNTYLYNTAATLSQAINGNTFNNLNVNTTGSITFITNSVIVPAAGTQNVNSNSISGTFTKSGTGGTVTLFTSGVSSVAGSVINNNNNNFSNITVSGATTIAGWVNTDAGNSTKTIQNNTFSNWTGGTGTVTAMSVNLTGTGNATTGNAINNITGLGSVIGIATGAGNDKIYSNNINTLTSSGAIAASVSGISITAGTTKNIYQNTIYNLQNSGATTGSVRGIVMTGGTTVNIYKNTVYSLQANALTTGIISGIWVAGGTTASVYSNKIYDLSSSSSTISSATVNGLLVSGITANLSVTCKNNVIGDLRATAASATDPVRGISLISSGITSNNYVYNNTVYLNATSTGANFGSSGIYHSTSATATTAKLDLRNNIIQNSSTPNGAYSAVAFRRSTAALTNYAATANNNLFYAGPPGANKLIFFDGTNADQTLVAYKARVSARDAESVTEDLITASKFLSTAGSSSSFLHLDPAKTTQAESGGVSIAGVTADIDAEIRQDNTGYSGTGTAPDIGADEFEGIAATALSGTYNVGTGQAYTSLTNAGGLFAAINSLGLSGNTVINITSDLTEDGSNVLYQWVEQGLGNYTLTIQPDASAARVISGNVTTGMIRFNGAKRVTINGSNGTTNNYLTFRNTNTAGTTGTAFTFINGATNNAIKYCIAEAYANATNGVILFSTSTVAGGNSNNLITKCNINATVGSNTGNVCIYSAGTVGKENTANTISNNNIYNYRDRALDIPATGSSAWIISGNSFYNGDVSGSINYAAATTLHTVRILGGAGYSLLNNYIGGNASLASGTTAVYSSTAGIISYQGILLTTTAALPLSVIKGNTVASISVSAVPTSTTAANVFAGIETSGSGINIGGSLAGDGNVIGSNTTNGSIVVTTASALTTYKTNIRGISCASAGGLISRNQVGGIDIKNIGAGPASSTFSGIYVNVAAAPTQVNNNIIGSTGAGAASNSVRVLSSSTSTTTSLAGISISATVTSTMQISGNTVQNLSFQNTNASSNTTGIANAATGAASITITNNTITGNTVNASTGGFYGIYNNAAPATLAISNNTVSSNTSTAGTTGFLVGIYSTGTGTSAISITNNTFSGNTTAALTTGVFAGVYHIGAPTSVNINSNTFYGNATTSASGAFYAIYNSGAVTGTININSNNIGTGASNAITYNAANSGTQYFINNTNAGAAASLSISNNIFQGINYAVAGTGNNYYILNSSSALSRTVNGNTFTNLDVNTSGSVYFISDNVALAAAGTENVNNNSVSGTFTKRASGTVTLFTSVASSAAGGVINNNNNNFSNITVTGATTVAGWVSTDAGSATKTVQNNTFTNWSGGTNAVTAMSVIGTAATSGNIINNITSAGTITGITTAAGNDNIYSNTINTLSSTGGSAVTAIAATAGATKNVYKNKIYDLSGSNAASTVNGILVAGGTTVTVYNNLIGDLRTPAASSATDAVRGISVTSATVSSSVNLYYNTVYLNATSTGATFGTSGIYHLASATATTAALTLRNNSVTNTSTNKGAGLTVAYRRGGTALNNYAAASNNNLFYAGVPSASKLIFNDGTASDQTLAAYITRVSTRDAASVTEDLTSKFLSTAGASSVFLHINSAIANLLESGASNIGGFTDDFDGQIRAGNTGYTGSSSSPDIGADEVFGIETIPPVITYTLLGNATSTANRSVTGVTITDASGVNTAAGTKPRIYYKRSSDANGWLDNSSSTNGWKYAEATNAVSPFTFTINYSILYGGASATAGGIQYFIVAQDIATNANVAINSGTFAASPSSVALTTTAFPLTGTINSYTIPFSGTYNVGTTEAFKSLTKADGLFASINAAGLMGNCTFNITSDVAEDGTNALNQWTETGAGNYTLTVQPDAATLRTLSGNAVGGLIRLDGAQRVTIDGRNSGSGAYLSFKNTNTSGTTGTAFTFINGAANNTIRYTDAQAYANATNGVMLFSTSAAGGNSNNLIDNCTINATVATNTGSVAIYSAGTAGNENASNTISNNSIYNYRDRALDITATGSTGWTVSGNSFYNGDVSSAVNYAASTTLHGIRVLGGSGYSIVNNYIGGNDDQASGSNAVYSTTLGSLSYQGILLTTGSATPASYIKGNTVAAISLSSVPAASNATTFTGIETSGSGINIGGNAASDGNIIGSTTANGSIIVNTSTASAANTTGITGINSGGSGGLVNNNQVSGFDISNTGASPAPSFFKGIYVNNAAAPAQVNNNLIGSNSTSNSVRVLPGSTSATTSLTGIEIGTAVNSAVQVSGNLIKNIANISTTSSGIFTGISNTATSGSAAVTVSSDTIQYIGTAANASTGSTVYAGIVSTSASTVSDNIISNITLAATGANAQIAGINVSGAYANTISRNIISNLSTASGKATAVAETGSPAGSSIIGILNSATAAGQVISNNTLAAFSTTSVAAINSVITGIGITATVSGNVFNNRIASFSNTATGAGPAICGIMAANGSFNVYNNAVRISNPSNTNGIKIYGINHSASANWNYYFNTVRISGNGTASAARSAAFIRTVNGTLLLRNNVFINTRTGVGANYAVSNIVSPATSNWSASSSDYNDLYSSNASTTGEWSGGTNQTFAQWISSSGGGGHSVNSSVSFITSTYDLQPDSTTNCSLNNGGTPITTPVAIGTDINNNSRNSTNPDLGAYEFSYTPFTIITGNDSPVCSGDSVNVTVNPGAAISPVFSWTNPLNVVISTEQNPSVAAIAGQYKVRVTDVNGCYATDSTLVLLNQRPTATITSESSLCDSGFVHVNIAVTGTGTINGTLSNGDTFSGSAPLIIVPVFITATTSLSITDLSDGICTAIASDIPDTVTITVTHKGDWLGITDNWNDAVNWCEGIIPTSTTDVTIPSGTPKMPVIRDSVYCNNLIINTGDTLTITSAGTLNIAGLLTSSGTFRDNGTTDFNGTSGQQTFSGVNTFNNLTLNNAGGLLLPTGITVNNNLLIAAGTLNANNFGITVKGNWTNNASTTAFAAGTSIVTFNGTIAQSIRGAFASTFNNLTIATGAATVTLYVNAGINGVLTVSSGTFDLAGFTANRATAGGTLTVAGNATLKIGGTNTFPANYTTNTLGLTSTVEYSGTNQAVANQSYGNLRLSSSSGAAIKTFPGTAMTVAGNLSSIVGTGTSVSFTAAANITVNGNVSIGASTTFNGGNYVHRIGGNWTNSGTFAGSTGTITFTGSGAAVSGAGTQNFNNLTVAASGVTFSAASITLTGNLATSGSGSFTQASGGTLLMSGTGKTISGTGISPDNLSISGSVSTAVSFILTGNLSVSGSFSASNGTITMNGSSKTISGGGTIAFYVFTPLGSVTANTDFSIASGLLVNGSFSASAGTATFTGTSSLTGTANLFNTTINGTSLQLSGGSNLGIANILTITSGTLDVVTSGPNTVDFNGTGAQSVNSLTYSNLVLSNGNTKTAVGPVTTAYDLTIASGTTFNPAAFTHSIYGNWINNGTFVPGISTVQFAGTATSYITGATTFNILTSNTSATTELILQSNVSAAIVNMTEGIIQTGTNTLTITNTRTGPGLISGNIQRTHAFTTGVAYAFEGPQNTVTFSAVSSVTSVTVSVTEGSISDFPFGGSISRVYDISVPSGTYNASLRLHYEDDELNGNNESTMALWHYNGSAWVNTGKTSNSTSLNYVELNDLTDITNRWTASDNSNLVRWNGSVSTNWNTAANWTVVQGSGSTPPSSSDIVDLGSASFTYQPTISNSVTVKNIIFGSSQPVTLTLGGGGSLNTLGDIHGNWSGNATHTINVNNQALTIDGSMDLSDGTNSHVINLNIAAGSVTTLGSLSETGGANITFTGAGALNVFGDFVHNVGTFTAGSGTVTYDGSENQDIANLNYNNLTVNKSGGLAEINDTVNVAGNLLVSAGQLDNNSITTVAGNVTINAGDTLYNYDVLHVQGNWNNNGTYADIGSDTYFDGSGAQTIKATTFNNLIINKPSGTASLTGDVTLTGDLTINSGTFDIQTYFFDRNLAGGTATTANGATFMIGANNPPRNFTNNIISASSTTIFYGSTPLFIALPNITFGNLIFRGTGLKTVLAAMTVNGDLTIESASVFNATSAPITLNGNWTNNGTFTPSTSTVLLNGTSKTVTGNTIFNKVTVSGTYNYLSNITFNDLYTVTNTGIVTANDGTLTTVNGDFTNNGGYINSSGTITYTGNVLQTLRLINAVYVVDSINFNGTVAPVLNSSSGPRFSNVAVNNTGGVTAVYKWIVYNSFTVGAGATWNGGAYSHDIFGNLTNNGTITGSGTISFLPSTAATINLGTDFSNTGRVYFGGTGAITIAGVPAFLNNVNINNSNSAGITPASAWNITKDLRVVAGSIFNAGNYTHFIGGNISNSGTINSGASTFTLNGNGAQDIKTVSNFNNLTINKSTGSATLSNNATVNGVLNFVAGNLQTGSHRVIQPSSGTVTNAGQNTGWVNGNLQKYIAAGGTSAIFEVGDSATYSPASVAFSNVTAAGNLIASASRGDHPNVSSSSINASKSVNRFWTLTNSGIAFNNYSATFNFTAADIDAGASTSSFGVGLYNGSAWSSPATASANATNIQATGLTGFGDFAIGEVCYAGTAFSYTASPYCSNAGTASVTATGTGGGAYTSTAGLTIDAATGDVTLGTSTAGTYTVTYTIAASGGCGTYTTTASIRINAAPAATISYDGSPYCFNAGTASVTNTGTSGGTYTSTTGLSINASSGDVTLATSTSGSYTVSYTVAAAGGCSVFQTTAAIVIQSAGLWTGAISTDYTNAGNWSCGGVPAAGTDISIPAGASYYPAVTAVQAVNNITVESGASVTVTGTLQIAGTIINNGTIDASAGTIEMNGSTAQTIPAGMFSGNNIQDLIISNNVTLAGQVYVTGSVSFGNVNNKTFTTGGFLTLGSGAAASAQIADITNIGANSGNSIGGEVTAEKYFSAKRAFRFLSAPVNTSGSIRANWMENTNNPSTAVNNNPLPGYGTHITGFGGDANGFDATITNNPSLFTFDNQTQAWASVTTTTGVLKAGSAYRIFVRGSRSSDLNTAAPVATATTLRATGAIVSGTVVMKKPGAGGTTGMPELSSSLNGYSFIGNPYPAPIDWLSVEKADIGNTIYIFDPTINGANGRGAYVSYNSILEANNNASSFVDNNIQSWQSLFVLTTGPDPAITFEETHKSSLFRPVFRTPGSMPRLTVQLLLPQQAITGGSADGLAAYFDDHFDSAIAAEDSYKFTNLDENIAILRDGKALSMEGRKTVTGNDTLPIKMWQLTQKSYTFKIGSYNFPASVSCYLEDGYLQTSTLVYTGADRLIPFTITADAASVASDRFRIVFKTAAVLPVQLSAISAYQKDKGSQVEWTVYEQNDVSHYEVERSADTRNFAAIGRVEATGNSAASNKYSYYDEMPLTGDNYYRIKVVLKSGKIKYSDIAIVNFAGSKGSMVINPNPVEGNTVNIQFKNLDKGDYVLKLLSNSGQQIFAAKISHSGGSSIHAVKISTAFAKGIYQLQLTNGSISLVQKVIFQ